MSEVDQEKQLTDLYKGAALCEAKKMGLVELLLWQDERIMALEAKSNPLGVAISKEGWRSCIDHLIRPYSPCPVCKIEELTATFKRMENAWREEVEKEKARWLK